MNGFGRADGRWLAVWLSVSRSAARSSWFDGGRVAERIDADKSKLAEMTFSVEQLSPQPSPAFLVVTLPQMDKKLGQLT